MRKQDLGMWYQVFLFHPSGILVLGSKLKGHINFGKDFSLYQNTDLRLNIKRFKTNVIPIVVGVYGGFDYSRVWTAKDTSNLWHTSYGGGIYVNGLNLITSRVSLFSGSNGARINFNFKEFGFGMQLWST
ncbi:hypothetical protein K1F50_18325 [Muricauda oceani]|uniref:Outer membrane protein beta-barrel domain-containing protein n=1 Tax=Flagellimonas oceani TaxID=2698672 RepID=A0A6G7IZD3_9FLAO|nr:hypothetical protein [Allomuricauda oceani]MBW8244771.1 hypothetical protein [Allomuricauda oceani]QII43915.1 hypothetical protein GVT53_04235 [Allomuricauda oceani]